MKKKTLKSVFKSRANIYAKSLCVDISLKFIERQNEKNKNSMFLIPKLLILPGIILLTSYASMKASFNNSCKLYRMDQLHT